MFPAAQRRKAPATCPLWAVSLFVLACGCGASDEAPATGPAPEFDVGNPALPAGAANLPFDPRVATMLPDAFVGTEQICDLTFVATPRVLGHRMRTAHGSHMTRGRHIRCAGSTGQGWADLLIRKDRDDLDDITRIGMRIRTRVLAPEGGFENYPVLELLGSDGPTPEDATPSPAPSQPGVGENFEEVETGSAVHHCAVAYAGRIERLQRGTLAPRWQPSEDVDAEAQTAPTDRNPLEVEYRERRRAAPYPGNASHRLAVACRHAHGESWLDVVFTRETFPSALDVRRGRTLAVRIHRPDAGLADSPIAIFVPLGRAAPRVANDGRPTGESPGAEAPASTGDSAIGEDEVTPTSR